MKENVIKEKSYAFAVEIVKFCDQIQTTNRRSVLFDQLLKSWTSVWANVSEAIHGQSKKDFLAKLYIAYKEANETHYWLLLFKESGHVKEKVILQELLQKNEELIKILGSITKTVRESLLNH